MVKLLIAKPKLLLYNVFNLYKLAYKWHVYPEIPKYVFNKEGLFNKFTIICVINLVLIILLTNYTSIFCTIGFYSINASLIINL